MATIRKPERGELRPPKRLAERLAQELEVAVTQHASLVSFARAAPRQDLAPDRQPIDKPRHSNLNLRAALVWGMINQATEVVLRLVTALQGFWDWRSYYKECITDLSRHLP